MTRKKTVTEMERRILKSKSTAKRKAELFVLAEDRINTRKAMTKETACTFEKLFNSVYDEKKK